MKGNKKIDILWGKIMQTVVYTTVLGNLLKILTKSTKEATKMLPMLRLNSLVLLRVTMTNTQESSTRECFFVKAGIS